MSTQTRVVRDPGKTASNTAAALVIAVGTYYALWTGERRDDVFLFLLSSVPIAGALFFLHRAIWRSAGAPCPGCGHAITGLATGANAGVACRFCGRYVEGERGALRLTADDHVADTAIYATLVPREITWPEGCCVCGEPATRTITIEAKEADASAPMGQDLAVRVATLGTMKLMERGQVHRREVPHCAAHGNGAVLSIAGEGETGLAIAFRSHRYLTAFCDKNGTLPRT